MMTDSFLDQADEAAGGFLTRSKKFLPFAARACLMASTLEDSWRYIREFTTYKTYLSNVWMTDELEQDWFLANLFIWPLCFKLLPGLLMVTGLLDKKIQQRFCFFMVFMCLYNMLALKGYPGGINFNLWQCQQMCKLLTAIILVYAEACEESRNLFAGLPQLGQKFTKQSYMSLIGRLLFGFLFFSKIHFIFTHWRFLIDWVVNLPCVVMIVLGFKTKFFACGYIATLIFDNFYFHRFWQYFDQPFAYEHVAYEFFANLTLIGVCLQWVLYGPGGLSLDKQMKKE